MQLNERERADVLSVLTKIVEDAGKAILSYRNGNYLVRSKADASPVTSADLDSASIIRNGLRSHFPKIAIISEEDASADPASINSSCFFLVDPLDGTREFIAGRDEFTVNVALVEGEHPSIGVVYAPSRQWLVVGSQLGAYERRVDSPMRRISCTGCPRVPPVVLVSRSHLDPATLTILSKLPNHVERQLGSSLKFLLVAVGEADAYVRLSPTMAWDTAAGQAVLEAAGGAVLTVRGSRLHYQRPISLRNPGFVAASSLQLAESLTAVRASAPDT